MTSTLLLSITKGFGVSGEETLEASSILAEWTDLRNSKRNALETVTDKLARARPDRAAELNRQMLELKREVDLADLEVSGWDIYRAQKDQKKVPEYLERQLKQVVAKINSSLASPAGSVGTDSSRG